MKLKIKKLHPDAKVPTYGTDMASGFDLSSTEELILQPLKRALVNTGLAFEIPAGFEVQIRPRSGLAFKHGVTVLNTPGTVDSDYRGSIKVILYNSDQFNALKINVGDRIAQGVLAMVTDQVQFEEVEDFDNNTTRADKGFGSTGVN